MKRISYMIITVLTMFMFNIFVKAASANLSVSSNSVYVGDTFTVSVNMSSSAAWNIHVSSSGPVSGCTINQADATGDALDTNKTFSANCTATGEGVITISLSGDVTSSLDGNAVGISGSKTVSISKRPDAPTPQPSNNTNNNQTNKEEKKEDKSNNNNLKEISIEGYELTKVDNNNYTLSVSNDVTSISVNASAEDTKATITGTGKHDINVGDNNIEIIIKSESGSENKINIKVTRKDGYYLEDLSDILSKDINDININIKADSKLSSQDLTKIKESKRKVKLNYYDDNKKLLYSWIIDGSKINDFDSLLTTVSYELEKNKDIYKLSNYADGIYIVVSGDNTIPKGTKIKLYVGDNYKDNDLLNIYYYNKNNKELINSSKSLKVKDGYIEFEVSESGDYFITMSSIDNSVSIESNSNGVMNILLIIIIILSILIVLVSTIMIILLKGKNKGVSNN